MINHYEKIAEGNFGDDLNSILWEKVFGKAIEHIGNSEQYFIGIGTRLRRKNIPLGKPLIIFGAGYGYESISPQVDSNWDIRCVRGPLTAEKLKIGHEKVITDPAILARKIAPKQEKIYSISLIPHHLTAKEDDWSIICKKLGINYIDPRKSPVEVIMEIDKSEFVITESLHGAIIADTFRIPWIPFYTRSHFSKFKWDDWSASMKVVASYHYIKPLFNRDLGNKSALLKVTLRKIYSVFFSALVGKYQLNKLKGQKSYLSSNLCFEERLAQMEDCVKQFKSEYV